jgi:hypothetical protein
VEREQGRELVDAAGIEGARGGTGRREREEP